MIEMQPTNRLSVDIDILLLKMIELIKIQFLLHIITTHHEYYLCVK